MRVVALQMSRMYALAKAGCALLGLSVVCAVTLLPVERNWLFASFPTLTGDAIEASRASAGATAGVLTVQDREQRALAEFIARRWRIADSAATSFVSIAYRAGERHSVDPLLILSVMAIESRYNPVAESTVGAKGLMQIMPKFHLDKLLDHGGEEALLDPEVNIHVGAQILREYYRRLGDQEAALQMYGGAFDEPTARYAAKVFDERMRLEPIRQRARKPQTGQSA